MEVLEQVKEKPILFSGPLVRAVLEGRKTQTRRVMKLPTWSTGEWRDFEIDGLNAPTVIAQETGCFGYIRCPYGSPGDQLWVRETWQASPFMQLDFGQWYESVPHNLRVPSSYHHTYYRADLSQYRVYENLEGDARPLEHCKDFDFKKHCTKNLRWRPSIHMPRWASRIQLEITDVRVERLQHITSVDIDAEGVDIDKGWDSLEEIFAKWQELWDSINEKRGFGWDANPWVWVVEFKRLA